MHIRLATLQDIKHILNVTKACASYMVKQKIFQWNENYPSKTAFINDVARKELYVLEEAQDIIGCIVLTPFMDKEYIPIQWLTPNTNNMYIHRLAVHPKAQGNGNAQRLMSFAEQFAIENNYSSIRLDTFSKNKRNQKFYELRNYKKLGSIFFPKQSVYPFYCYERIL